MSPVALRSVTGVALIAATVLASGVTSVDANVVKVAVPAIGRTQYRPGHLAVGLLVRAFGPVMCR